MRGTDSIATQGLDTPTPFLQLSGTIFKGQHDTLLGTELLFTEQKGIEIHFHSSPVCSTRIIQDEVDRSKRFLNPAGTTEQRIRFKEIQLRPKTKNPSDLFAEADATSNAANLADSGGDNSQTTSIVDRMTGKTVPVASRKGKKIGDRQVKSSRKRKGKEKEDNADNEMEGENVTVDKPESANEEPMNLAEG